MTVWRSLDDGASYQPFATIAAPAVMGETLDDLTSGPTSRWDKVATARVKLSGGALASASDLRVLSGANAAAVQRPDGAWEILQFANAVLVGERTYQLSRLLRGELGSEHAIGAPLAAGAPFVLLDQQIVPAGARARHGRAAYALPRCRGEPRPWRSERGRDRAAAGNACVPAARAGASEGARETGGVRFSWRPRRRGLAGVSFAVRPDLGEASEAYELEILSGVSVLRTLSATAPSTLYAASDETLDFGSTQSSFAVRLYQISAAVGRGLPATATLTP